MMDWKDKIRKSNLKLVRENLTFFGIVMSQFRLTVRDKIPEGRQLNLLPTGKLTYQHEEAQP